MTKILNQIRSFLASDSALRIVIYIGVILYTRQYFLNRSLWLDEAMLSLGIIESPIRGYLHQPLVFNQAAPFGFLVIEKILISLLGSTEAVLRLFPFFCGIVSLWLFARMARIYLQGEAAILAVLAFVVTPSLIYYSSEVKPYYIDFIILLFSYVVLAEACLNGLDYFKSIIIGLLGAVLIWFSFPSVFVMFSIGLVSGLYALSQKDWHRFSRLSVVLFLWVLSFIICYLVLLSGIVHHKGTEVYWKDGFISFKDENTWFLVFNNILKYPVGISRHLWLAGLCFLAGGYLFFKEDKRKFFLLVSVFLMVCLASGLHKYSCKHRLVLFLVPIFILMIINGVRMISSKFGKYALLVTVFLVSILFYDSFSYSFENLIKPKGKSEIRPVLFYIKDHQHPGDIIYLYSGAVPAFKYYLISYVFPFHSYIDGHASSANQKSYLSDLNKIRTHNRVWVVFAHIFSAEKPDAKRKFLRYLDGYGKNPDHYEDTGSSTYLYEFSKEGI